MGIERQREDRAERWRRWAAGGELLRRRMAGLSRNRPFGLGLGSGLDGEDESGAVNSSGCSVEREGDRWKARDGEGRHGPSELAPASDPERDRGEKGVEEGPASIFTTT